MSTQATGDTAQDMLRDLRRDLLEWLPLPTAFAAVYALVFVNHAFGLQRWPVFAVVVMVASCSIVAHRLRRSHQEVAGSIYVASLGAAVLALTVLPVDLGLLFFPAVILLSNAMLGVRRMVGLASLGILVVLLSAIEQSRLDYSVAGPIALICLTAVVAWLSHRNLATAVEWAWNSYQQARASTEEARQRRAELARTLKALDEAYYRLERFSAQLAQAREAAEEARRAKQQFVATVSHELRTPLNIIIGFAELITLSPESYGARGVPRQLLGDVNRIYRSAQHLKGLIDDVLDLSQIDARHMILVAERASLGEVIVEATDMIWSLATQKGLRLVVSLPESLPPLTFDRLRIRQVLLNLLSNAVRFTEVGQIEVAARLQGAQVQVTVSDTGPGIAPDDLERVFEEFRQLDVSLSRTHGGTGLGLALSRGFVGLHGGRMWAQSELGRGSRFHFTLPIEPVARDGTEARAPLPLPREVEAHKRQMVLVAGQEPMVVNLLRRHLRGYEVVGVPADELPAAVGSHLPQALILNEPEGATPSPGEQPRPAAGELVAPVPVISCPLPDPASVGRSLGVDRYLVKPVTRERLLDLLAGYGDSIGRVLIVDDDAQLAGLMARIVRAVPWSYEVEVACGGREGWARMQEWRPDLVLLDLVMQDLDGLAVLQLMRADPRLRAVRVVVVTARDLPSTDSRLPGRSIRLQGPENLTVSEVLNYLQALLDALPPPRPAPSPPPRPPAGPPAPPAS